MLFPLGSSCIIEKLDQSDNHQIFFRGHSNPVSAVAVSPCGKYLASGQVTHMGYKASIHVYTLADHQLYATFILHKVSSKIMKIFYTIVYIYYVKKLSINSLFSLNKKINYVITKVWFFLDTSRFSVTWFGTLTYGIFESLGHESWCKFCDNAKVSFF